jgi:hypothetical protein
MCSFRLYPAFHVNTKPESARGAIQTKPFIHDVNQLWHAGVKLQQTFIWSIGKSDIHNRWNLGKMVETDGIEPTT